MTEEGTDGGARILRTLRSFGPINMDDFDDRLRTQKLAYLIQEVGGSDGPFVYQWYIRGPYSSALTQEIFSCEEGGGQPGAAALSGDERALAQRVRSLMGDRVDDPARAGTLRVGVVPDPHQKAVRVGQNVHPGEHAAHKAPL